MRRLGAALLCGAALVSCSARTAAPTDGRLRVIAAESFWGSIASQLGGDHVDVTSVVTSPDTDPHDYEPTTRDGRAFALARYVVLNGLGYDSWAREIVDAHPVSNQSVLDVGHVLGLRGGDNPHRWYFPADVRTVVRRITDDYKALDPAHAAYYDAQRHAYEHDALARYDALLAEIQRYAGTAVGASETVFAGIAAATGLDLVTPSDFMTAVSEGADPPADAKRTVDDQIASRRIAVFVYNQQNATPDVQTIVDAARAAGVAVTTVTETPPEGVTFQDWQVGQLQALLDALRQGSP